MERITAFIIDNIILMSLMILIFGGITKLLNYDFDLFKNFSSINDISILGVILYGIIFITYFSIIDLFTTPGKNFLNLEVKRVDEKDLRISDTLIRSSICLLSLFLFFMPLFLDFQDRLSETKIAKSNV